jgi:hypothetical protein
MTAALDVFAVHGHDDYLWLGCALTHEEAVNLIRRNGSEKSRVFFVHSQRTGSQTFYRTDPTAEVVRLDGPPDFSRRPDSRESKNPTRPRRRAVQAARTLQFGAPRPYKDPKQAYRDARFQFVVTELSVAITFFEIARSAPGDEAKIARNLAHAEHAYEAARRFLEDFMLTEEMEVVINEKLQRLSVLSPARRNNPRAPLMHFGEQQDLS